MQWLRLVHSAENRQKIGRVRIIKHRRDHHSGTQIFSAPVAASSVQPSPAAMSSFVKSIANPANLNALGAFGGSLFRAVNGKRPGRARAAAVIAGVVLHGDRGPQGHPATTTTTPDENPATAFELEPARLQQPGGARIRGRCGPSLRPGADANREGLERRWSQKGRRHATRQ
jgi:hypothetical protein